MTANEDKLREHLKWMTTELRQARRQLADDAARAREPIAIVSMACRFPGGVRSPEDLWQLVLDERDAIAPLPADRGWQVERIYDPDPDRSGKTYVREGGFLDEAGDFDAEFFGISPREALAMDPQQRLLLETSWEAVERAGIDPTVLKGTKTGVFTGVMYHDYASRVGDVPEGLEGYLGNGSAGSIASGRVAYTFGFEGPAVTVDTACSSALVAMHLAAQALRHGECAMALAGGVTVMSTPQLLVEFSRQRGLAADGRSKAFSAAADGFGAAEGIGVLVLERLSDARANGHPVLAVLRGSAVNSDGASNGLTAPNGPSQQRVITQALESAGLTPADVDVIEAHGTGTPLGDPIEAQALQAVYGQDRARPALLGSVKSNIGHTQAAAGAAGVIKMVMAMRHGTVPRTLHVDEPSPHIDWSAGAVELAAVTSPWPELDRPRRAAVSSFGASGTNTHVILEDVPVDDEERPSPAGDVPWVISARTVEALADQTRAVSQWPGRADDIGFSLATGRAHLSHRTVVLGGATVAQGVVADNADKSVFVFPGQGSQWAGMGLELLDTSPVFAARMAECATALRSFVDWNLTDVLADAEALERVDVVQPALWAVMVSLAEVWRSYGVRPAAVLGHSQGEIAAACVAGALSLEDGARVVALRSKALASLSGDGGMVSVPLPADDIPAISGLSIAAINGPRTTVVSGGDAALDEVLARVEGAKRIPVDYASHSAHMEPLRDRLLAELAPVTPRTAEIPFYSTVTGERLDTAELGAEYWYRSLRQTVRFEAATRELLSARHGVFLEVSPHPVLTIGIQETIDATGNGSLVLGTLRRDDGGAWRLATALAEAYVNGVPVDWRPMFPDARTVDLPTYPFQRRRYWLEASHAAGDLSTAGLRPAGHPLLAAAVELASGDGLLLTGILAGHTHPWLADHAVHGTVLLPGVALAELVSHAGTQVGCDRLAELTLHIPLVLPEHTDVKVQVFIGAPDESGDRPVTVHSGVGDGLWTKNATGTLAQAEHNHTGLYEWPPTAESVSVDGYYERLGDTGFVYGPAFQGLRAAWSGGDDVFAEITLPDGVRPDGFTVHPAFLDAALHALGLGTLNIGEQLLPFALAGVELWPTRARTARVKLTRIGPATVSVLVADDTDAPIASISSLALRPVARDQLRSARPDLLHRLEWVPLAGNSPAVSDVAVVRCPVPTGDVAEAARSAVGWALEQIREWLEQDWGRLVFVTEGALAVRLGEDVSNLPLSAVLGLVRSAQTEHPGRFGLIDLDGTAASELALPDAVNSGEPQLAVRDGEILVSRLVNVTEAAPRPGTRLDVTAKGTLANLAVVPAPEALAPLAEGQVRIGMRAAGLNFRDVILALGMAPGENVMGSEGAGVVLEAGPGVALAPGDRVFGLFPGAFGPVVVADHRMVTRIPAGWSFDQAASVPIVFLTAYYGLHDLGRLQPGEKVLVHAAAGGVGMAAVQLARHFGAEVYGTASTGKWDATGLDSEHLASSRELGFEQKFPAVDVVLNSLSGEFVDASLRLLAEGGRFLEMGKTDIRTGIPGYRAFNLSEAGPDRLGEMLADVVALFEAGVLHPLPVRGWDITEATEALRSLGHAKHIGKLVLTFPRPLDGTALITGGTGTLGRLVARHLVEEHGITSIVLASRSGGELGDLADLDADIRIVSCDAADRSALAALLAEIPELSVVVHAAGVLDDGVVTALTADQVDRVFRAKVDAAVNLHELTEGLSAFVLFSSAAGTLGGAGQANYAAANTFLDALAQKRRAAGLPATALAWGYWAERSGMTGHLGAVDRERMTRSGVLPLSTPDALALFDTATTLPDAVLLPIRLATTKAPQAAPVGGLAGRLAGMSEAEQDRVLVNLVRDNAATVLGHDAPDAVPASRAFKELGFDSLTAVELRNRLNTATGLKLPATAVFDHPTPGSLAAYLRSELVGTQQAPATTTQSPAARSTASDDPIAIVAMACRFPGGVRSPEDLWRLVLDGWDAVSAFPTDRGWDLADLYDPEPGKPGRTYTRDGGFLYDAGDFDHGLFGVSPREAASMDPQQRLLLEVAWETFERAGIDPMALRGTPTAVITGATQNNYAARLGQAPAGYEAHLLTGNTGSVASGRISYTFGLEGPALTVDTGCSSALVSLHLAAQSLCNGESTLALAGGVAVIATPDAYVAFSQQRGMAADGRCKAFADAADGTGWSEGVGLLLLERLSDAQANGHPVLAVLRGSAVNQDGASNGLTAPNGPSQQRVIRQALADARLSTRDVDVVEGHGTGTTLGDPIEAQALIATYGQDRDQPLLLGSIKSNIGHTQAAAGAAGVIKMVMAMRHGVVPPTLHVDKPSRHVDWSAGAVSLVTRQQEWPATGRVRRAGVSSFGVSGTNAHVVLEQVAEIPNPERRTTDGPIVLSGHSPAALAAQARSLHGHLTESADDLADIGFTLSTRASLRHRAAILPADLDDLLTTLDQLADARPAPDAILGTAPQDGTAVAFVFPGQGSQWAGMALELLDSSPVFAERINECATALSAFVDWSLLEVLRGSQDLDRVDVVQPVLWAVMVSLAEVWWAHGVEPAAVLGHSQGEIAAACVAGALSLDDGARVVALRSKALAELSGRGGMVSVPLPAAEIDVVDGLSIAAINGPRSTVVSGTPEALDAVMAEIEGARRIPVDYASHSPQVEAIRERLLAELATISPRPADIPFHSAVTGERIETTELTADYWYRNLRETVRFEQTVRGLLPDVQVFVEVSPHPVLAVGLRETFDGAVVGTLRRDDGGRQRFLASLAEAHVNGVAVDWTTVFAGARRIDLPTYAFQRQRFWLEASESTRERHDDLFRIDWVASPLGAPTPDVVVEQVAEPATDDLALAAREATARVLARIQDWLSTDQGRSRLVVVTKNAVAIDDRDTPPNPALAAVWGLVRAAQAEHPDTFILVDTDGDVPPVITGEPELAYRAGNLFVPRLRAVTRNRGETPSFGDGTVLITGGTGSLGVSVARHLLEAHGVANVVLASRSGRAIPDLNAQVVACDVADREALADLLASIPDLTAVVHAAGVLADGVLAAQNVQRLDEVFRPKLDAAVHLHELTRDRDLAAFVLFSSAAGTLGAAGQSNYAAANAFLDAFAWRRRADGLPATSLAWGFWAQGTGMTDADAQRIQRGGLIALSEKDGLDLFDAALRRNEPVLVPARFDRQAQLVTVPAVLRADMPSPRPAEPDGTSLLDLVCAHTASVLGYASGELPASDLAFRDLGFDSLMAVELRNRLSAATGRRLSATLVFDYPTPEALAAHLGSGSVTITAAATTPADEPIAIVGMACRFPGDADSPEEFWNLLAAGADAVTGFPADRGWDLGSLYHPQPGKEGRSYVREGGFLRSAARFDAEFFGISPREAVSMDPQQRLLLETAWEALQRAGIDPGSLRGTPTGVFAGTNGQDYSSLVPTDDYLATGTSASVLSGRISYTLGLEGPAVTVDTACSSSLVAMHMAAQALRHGECELALAGGASVMATPKAFVAFSRQQGLAADGRCKPFAQAADGTGWGEGAGFLVLERLSDAQANGHPVLAVVRGSAVNQDGASNGLTAPNGPSQQRVIRQALANARLSPSDVDVVEAHGTGTTLGDPIEAQALLATYGQDRTQPVLLGSVKSNIGHTQAAAGVAGVIKVVLAMRHGLVPPTLHVDEPSQHVDWQTGAIELVAETRPWPVAGRPRRAGVSSFGVSGTNAHVIIEQGISQPTVDVSQRPSWPVLVSAKSATALRAQAKRLLTVEHEIGDIAYSSATTRTFDHRAVIIAGDTDSLRVNLTALAEDRPAAGLIRGVPGPAGKTALLFSGQGAQRLEMGLALAEAYDVYAEAFAEVCAHFDLPLREVLGSPDLDRTEFTQPALFAVEVALFRLVEHCGVRPDYLLGHSIGELAASHVSGALSLGDAATLVTARGRLMQNLPPGGAMVSIQASEAEVTSVLSGSVTIAAVNGPASTVISGDEDEVLAVAERLAGRKTRRLRVSHAFHSARMDPMLAEFAEVAAGITARKPSIPVISNVTGAPVSEFTPEYWVRHAREAVRFMDGLRWLADNGVTTFVEIGPDAALTPMTQDALPDAVAVASMRRDRPEPETLLGALGELHVRGTPVDFTGLIGRRRQVELPTYPFQGQSFWPVSEAPAAGWRYRIDWQPLPVAEPASLTGWLVIAADDTLAGRGSTVVRDVDAALLKQMRPAGLLALDQSIEDLLRLVHVVHEADVDMPVWLATRDAVHIGHNGPTRPDTAMVWGMGRVFGLEAPRFWGGLVDLPDTLDGKALDRLTGVLTGTEDQVAIRTSGVFGRRLRRDHAPHERDWRARGTVLVTGGAGGIGRHVVRWLASHGAQHIVVVSRSGAGADLDVGVPVTAIACDVTDRAALAAVLHDLPELTAVFHAAGTSAIKSLVDTEDVDEILRAKVQGARNLHELLADRQLDAFVLFSSVAGVWGSGGQGAYAAANAFLDALAEARRADGLAATSIAWGPWAGEGMVTAGDAEERLSRQGLVAMPPERAIAELHTALDRDDTTVVVADVDWDRFGPLFTTARARPLISDFIEETARTPEQRLPVVDVESLVRETVAAVLGHPDPDAIPLDRPVSELGFDSLTALELRTRLATATGLTLPSTLVFDHPTTRAVAEHLRAQLAGETALEAVIQRAASDEPIAIVAMACRYPGGVASPEELWRFVESGGDAIGEFPTDRGWDTDLYDPDPDKPGHSYVQTGGFLHDAGDFDAEFFGISPREALAMDPQQRLLLETSWEAFERAGIAPSSVRGSQTGVFVGAGYQNYAGTDLRNMPDGLDGHVLTGNATSVVSGRLAYTFGLQGPAVTVDTACSSSLVALHLAAQALRQGECDLALAGGATVMATPDAFIGFSRQRGLAPDGRCKAFAAAADGTGWSEGVGVLLVERLSDARRNGHPVVAIVRGTAINQDGASNGLTAPNGPAQQRVMKQALAAAGLTPSDVDLVEAHGTGTSLGDPIEAAALLATYGQDRAEPLLLGSVKSNIGHTQAASGIAGIIKVTMAMRHGVVPHTLHVDEPSPHVDWSAGAVSLVTQSRPWPSVHRPRRAAVSSFGVSGTNAHVVIEQGIPEPEPAEHAGVVPLVLSGRSVAALRAQAASLLSAVDTGIAGAAVVLATGRDTFDHRAVVLADGPETARQRLAALADGQPDPGVLQGTVKHGGKVAFLFPGQGSQWTGMAVDLLDSSPVFAERMRECAAALAPHVDWDLFDVLSDATALERVDVVQPVLFAVMVSLAEVWRSHGVEPDAVAGHSQGEIAAACVAGALSLADAAQAVALRSKALTQLAGQGAMAAVPLPADEVRGLVDGLSIAAINGPRSTVVSGSPDAVAELLATVDSARRIPVDYASHSAQVEDIRDQILHDLADIRPQRLQVPFYSTVEDSEVEFDADYCYRNLRQPVEFERATRALLADGYRFLIEISPHPVLTVGAQETIDAAGTNAVVLSTLRRDDGGRQRLLTALAEAHVSGVPVDWRPVLPSDRVVTLPTYPFQRHRFWLEQQTVSRQDHPFGSLVPLADDGVLLTGRLSTRTRPWLADHAVLGEIVLPGAAFVEMALRAGADVDCSHIVELTLRTPLVVRDEVTVQVAVSGPDVDGTRPVTIHSRAHSKDPWTLNATGTLAAGGTTAEWSWLPEEPLSTNDLYRALTDAGLDYGPSFQGLRAVWRAGTDLYAEVSLPEATSGFGIHPALLDSVLHAIALGGLVENTGQPVVPYSWQGVTMHATAPTALRARLSPVPGGVAIAVTDQQGAPVLTVGKLALRPISATRTESLWRVDWRRLDPTRRLAGKYTIHRAMSNMDDPVEETRVALRDTARALTADTDGTLVVLTRRAVGADARDLAGAAVWGLVRSVQTEHPGRFVLLDVDGDPDEIPDEVIQDITGAGEAQVAIRDGVVHVPRLARTMVSVPERVSADHGTVLITGGTGTLGRAIAAHLAAEHGVRSLVLLSRSGGTTDIPGAQVVQCDAGDRDALAQVVAGIPDLTGIVHAAGVLDDGLIGALTPERFDTVLRPKADAAWHLHELTRNHDIRMFVLFSAAAGLFGTLGQGNYAAANAFLDSLVEYRRTQGLPATAVSWGLWEAGSGMTGQLSQADLDRMRRSGAIPLTTRDGVALFDAALVSGEAVPVAVRLDLSTLDGPSPLLADLVKPARPTVSLDGLSGAELEEALTTLVRGLAATVLGHATPSAVTRTRGFLDAGFDSLTAVEFRNRLAAETDLRLPSTLIFDYPTPAALVTYLHERLATPADDPVLAELDRLTDVLSELRPDDTTRSAIAERLQRMLAGVAGTGPAHQDVESASDDELFGILDDELETP